jgi:hypothetical protein
MATQVIANAGSPNKVIILEPIAKAKVSHQVFEYEVRLRRLVNSKTLYLRVEKFVPLSMRGYNPITGGDRVILDNPYVISIDEYSHMLQRNKTPDKRYYISATEEDLGIRVLDKIKELYNGNWFKRMLLLRTGKQKKSD